MMIIFCLSLLAIQLIPNSEGLQSKCDLVCANNLSCRAGDCVLTKCSEDLKCLEYCFNCFGSESCYQTGPSCDYSKSFESPVNHCSLLRVSNPFGISLVVLMTISKNVFFIKTVVFYSL